MCSLRVFIYFPLIFLTEIPNFYKIVSINPRTIYYQRVFQAIFTV